MSLEISRLSPLSADDPAPLTSRCPPFLLLFPG
jgi:hypothetical protein